MVEPIRNSKAAYESNPTPEIAAKEESRIFLYPLSKRTFVINCNYIFFNVEQNYS